MPKVFYFMYACLAILVFNITDLATWFAEGDDAAHKQRWQNCKSDYWILRRQELCIRINTHG